MSIAESETQPAILVMAAEQQLLAKKALLEQRLDEREAELWAVERQEEL